MSGGRVELGLGAGWYDDEHTAYGIPFPPLGERFERLEEQLAIITGLWATPVGETFSFDGAPLPAGRSPGAAQAGAAPRPPIIIGGGGPKRTPRLAARFADEFNMPFPPSDDTGAAFDRVRAGLRRRRAATRRIVLSAAQVVCCGRDDAEIARRAAAIGRDVDELRANGAAGTPDEVVEKLGAVRRGRAPSGSTCRCWT